MATSAPDAPRATPVPAASSSAAPPASGSAAAPPAPSASAPAASASALAPAAPAPVQPPASAAAAPAPAPAAPAPPASAAPAKPAPPAAAPVAAVPRAGERGKAFVHLYVDHPGAWLEMRNYVDAGSWSRVCPAPCDRLLVVDGMEVRVWAPDMTTSNAFRIDPGRGRAQLKVSGGSRTARSIGIVGMATGVPVSLAGMGLYGYGRFADKSGLRTAGIVTLAVGAVTVLGSLPFLAYGGTTVRDGKGKVIAALTDGVRF